MIVEVMFLPSVATGLQSKLCVVIDVLRATSTLVAMLEAGARRILLSGSIADALAQADGFANRPLVCGESGGLPPAGFDRGNSPREFPPGSLEGHDLVFCTSNGTRATLAVAEAPVVLAGSMFNGSAVARVALREAREKGLDIALVCSGDFLGTRFAIDDAFCAGYLLSLMQKEMPTRLLVDARGGGEVGGAEAAPSGGGPLALDESATATLRLYRSYLAETGASNHLAAPPREAVLRAFWESHNAQVLREVGLAEDVEYCAQLDISRRVPRLHFEEGRPVLSTSHPRA